MRATFAFLLLVLAVQISVGKRDANWKFLEKFIVKSRTFDKEKLPSNFKHRFLRGRGSQPGLSAASIEDAVVELLKENQAPIQPNQHRVSKRVKSNCTENILIKSQQTAQCTVGQTAAIIECYIFVWAYKGSKMDSKNEVKLVVSFFYSV